MPRPGRQRQCERALAQGGIAAALGEGDGAAAHAHDTLEAGARHNDAAAVRWLCEAAPATVSWLAAQGVAFDRAADGRLQLGREGGHGARRIVHAGGDATGAALVRALRARVEAASHVQWRGGVDAEALLLRDGRVAGVRVRDTRGRCEEIEAAAVVLATGGIGALYAHTSNPPGADGAGLALALAAGAAPRDLEFVQFHPTALAVNGHGLPLLTEALRGAGARLLDAAGAPLMHGLHPLGDLAPRDVVARRVWQARQQGGAWLDATPVAGDWQVRFPTVLAACLAHGLDPRREPLPITPVAHFHMGGVATDLDGRSSLPGLHAVGEAACNGVHGANRLASNSLLEAVAGGRRLGAVLAATARLPAGGTGRWIERGAALPPKTCPRCANCCGTPPGRCAKARRCTTRGGCARPLPAPAGRCAWPRRCCARCACARAAWAGTAARIAAARRRKPGRPARERRPRPATSCPCGRFHTRASC
ncbi:L-aspartate oxidase [Rhodanobacter sp. FW106-PBR-LB-2-19]|uniref:L-aspartate oxidase n=1 Tax=Rhodanobacter sp. FW106-PBR-LB-2-19 TaxID=2766737 RepID=UPI0034E375B4